MKKMILLTTLIAAFLILLSPMFAIGTNQEPWKKQFCKKWHFHYCVYLWKKYDPEKEEKNDYILFRENMTYESVDEGKKSKGKWSYNPEKKVILMNDGKESIKLIVDEVKADELVFEIEDKQLKGIDFHYSANKDKLKK